MIDFSHYTEIMMKSQLCSQLLRWNECEVNDGYWEYLLIQLYPTEYAEYVYIAKQYVYIYKKTVYININLYLPICTYNYSKIYIYIYSARYRYIRGTALSWCWGHTSPSHPTPSHAIATSRDEHMQPCWMYMHNICVYIYIHNIYVYIYT